MAKNRLVVNHLGDSIQLSWQRGLAAPRLAPPVTFEHPFNDKVLASLRWYLEEYLRFPYGIEPDNAAKVEQNLQVWGRALFELVFRSSEKAREFFQEATRERLEYCEIGIASDDPVFLNLPWELLYSPDYQFLAPSLAGMYRIISGGPVRAEMPPLPQDKLNILLIIARPYGERDVPLKTIARPVLAALKPIWQRVNLQVLRPPSFERFERELNANKGFYHIVHFDGHGDFDAQSQGFQHSFGTAGQGVLVFESADGSPQVVTAAQIAQSLNDCGVPIFLLNACKSAREGEGEGSFSSVATRLVSLGAKGVVAMGYSVQAEAAKHFMGRLYEELVQGVSLDMAVAAGRREILNQRLRPSPKGNLPLADWMVPILFQQESYAPFAPPTGDGEVLEDLEEFLEEPRVSGLVDFPEVGAYGFVGRDYDILRLERGFRQNTSLLLQGRGGTGKTELACGFARWLEETGGRGGRMFLTSFEQGAGLSRAIDQVGRAVWGEKFSEYGFEKQGAAVLKYLKTRPCLLIWDNFEPVAGFPAGNEPLVSEEGRGELKDFLKGLCGGESWVLITSQREERWLDCGYGLLSLGGLSRGDAEELASKILERVGVDRKNLPGEYLELLGLLGGHPLSLRVVLPHLKSESPQRLIEELRRGLARFAGNPEEGREKSLKVSLDYSFARLSERTRRHLPFLAFLSGRVNADRLGAFSESPNDQYGRAYQALFEENLQESDWLRILNEAVEAGIVEHLGETFYKIHPTLPWYLRQRLAERHSKAAIEELEKKLLVFYALLAQHYRQQLIGNAEVATLVLRFEEPNLLQNLRLVEQPQVLQYAQAILQALGELYERQGRKSEFRSLRQRAVKLIGTKLAEAKARGEDAFNFWIYLRGIDAEEALEVADWEAAKAVNQEILDELTALKDSSVNDKIAVVYHQLGIVAQEQRQFDQAISYYQKALQIYEEVGDFYQAAYEYHELGMVAEKQRQFDQAISYYQKALQIKEDAGDFYHAASDYHHLGMVAEQQRQFDQAIAYYQKALQIREDVGDFYKAASDYHHLGMVAQEQGQFDQAIAYYQKALQIYEDMGDFYQAAYEYHELGMVAQEQKQFDQAIAYYQKALQIYEDARDFYKAANDYHQLGTVAQEQRQFDQAIAYYQKALQIREDVGDFYKAAEDYHNLGMVAREQQQFDQAIAYYQKALQIYEDARDFYKVANDYHQLGTVAQEQQQFNQAIAYYQKSLKIYEDAGDFYKAAYNYHNLGMVAGEQQQLDQAIAYFQKAIQIRENAGDYYNAAISYHNLGMVAQEQRQFNQAIAYFQKAFATFSATQDWYKASLTLIRWGKTLASQANWTEAVKIYILALVINLQHNKQQVSYCIAALGRMLNVLGEDEFSTIWQEETGWEFAGEVREAILAASEG